MASAAISPTSFTALPMRNGVSASYVWLPEGHWDNVLEFLLWRFPDVSPATWVTRLQNSEVVDATGCPLHASSIVKRGMQIYYYRELARETHIPFCETILHSDAHLLVVDKPHFLPVIPTGRFLHESLLVRLKKQLNMPELTPIHRLDRETAGVILFSKNPASRGAYQSMFQQRVVEKIYHALAPTLPNLNFPLTRRSRMVDGEKFFVMQEAQGEPNSETRIKVLEQRGTNWLYELHPRTGKKHQLRVHLASLGAPIVNDAFYPVALPCKGDDFSRPLKLLAKSLAFTDPITAETRKFHSNLSL